MALQVQGEDSKSFSAGFELAGAAERGRLVLFTPLGGAMAELTWAPGEATLVASGKTSRFESLDALVLQATGSAVPVTALFDWLGGTPTPVAGWQPNLSQLASGRIAAKRTDPPPVSDLRVVLEK